jgi:hypothetical protein
MCNGGESPLKAPCVLLAVVRVADIGHQIEPAGVTNHIGRLCCIGLSCRD